MLSQGNNEGNSEGDPGEISAQLRRGTGKSSCVIPDGPAWDPTLCSSRF